MEKVNEASIDKIRIVEYDNSYAKSLTKMWNMSGDNWGGRNSVITEEDIIQENENSDNLNIYLAVDGEEVVGYCSFGEYKFDKGALYIPLLNVRPDYHGKRIGKKLVLKAVDRTIELGWPRLDLFTWPGNTKAVPLYKKTGFFWEKNDNSTHLMNFIPTVLNAEPLKEYFEDIDWYKDSIRDIKVKPDGDEEKDYSNYEYLWQKDDKIIKVEFEKKGRGIRLIETPDYLIEAKIENHKLIFGNEYKVEYHMVNKTGKPLNVSIKGLDDNNIKFLMDESVDVKEKQIITGVFDLEEIKEEQDSFKTHPAVTAKVTINGKSIVFKVGIETLFPAKINIDSKSNEKYINAESECFLNLQNNFDEDVVFKLKLTSSQDVEFLSDDLEISMKAKERQSIAIPYILRKPCLYSTNIDVKAVTKDGLISFSPKVTGIFKCNTGAFGGETKEYWMVCNGEYTLKLIKFDNEVVFGNFTQKEFETAIISPKLGMPLSSELSKKKPDKVEYITDDKNITLKAVYSSSDFKDIELTVFFTLSPNGLVKHYHQITNLGDRKTDKEIHLRKSVYYNFSNSFIPYENEIVQNIGQDASYFSFWENSKLSENWIFSKANKASIGISWPKERKPKFFEWFMGIDDNFGIIDSKQTITTEPMYLAINTFKDYKQFRNFALQSDKNEEITVVDKFDFSINNGNPFVIDSFDIKIKNHHKINFNGDITIHSMMDKFPEISKTFIGTEEIRENVFSISDYTSPKMDIVNCDVDFEDIAFKRQSAIFNINSHKAVMKKKQEEGMEILSIDNGSIIMKAAPQFAPCLYSITYNQREWLHSSFPTPKPFSWWNPWMGGIGFAAEKLSTSSVMNEESTGEFVELKDNFNNLWQGIKLTLNIKKHDDYKGLKINQYFMTIADLPVILTTTEILQNTGYYFDSKEFFTYVFIKPEDKLKDSWFDCKNLSGDIIKYKGGKRCDIEESHMLTFGGKNIKDRLIMYNTGEKPIHARTNNLTIGNVIYNDISCKSGGKAVTKPAFLFFNKDSVEEKLIKDFKNIKLKI